MILKTGRKCTWDEIEVGEIFAIDGCLTVAIKINKKELILLESDANWFQHKLENVIAFPTNGFIYSKIIKYKQTMNNFETCFDYKCFYKLPKSVQRLWKCEE